MAGNLTPAAPSTPQEGGNEVALVSGMVGAVAAVVTDQLLEHTPAAPVAGYLAAAAGSAAAYVCEHGGVLEALTQMFAPEPAVAPAHVASLPVTPTPVATVPATDWSGALPDPASWDPAPDYTYLLLTHAALCGHEDAHEPIGDPPQAPDAPS